MDELEAAALEVHGTSTLDDARRRAHEVMDAFPASWWVAGAWALDLHLGRRTRAHGDLEMSVLHRDTPLLFEHLAGWELRLAGGGAWARGHGEPLAPEIHQAWARPDRGEAGAEPIDFVRSPDYVEFLFETTEDDEWVYRRDGRIRRPLSTLGVVVDGTPVLAPAVVLLFKGRFDRDKDVADYDEHAARLEPAERAWLEDAIARAHP